MGKMLLRCRRKDDSCLQISCEFPSEGMDGVLANQRVHDHVYQKYAQLVEKPSRLSSWSCVKFVIQQAGVVEVCRNLLQGVTVVNGYGGQLKDHVALTSFVGQLGCLFHPDTTQTTRGSLDAEEVEGLGGSIVHLPRLGQRSYGLDILLKLASNSPY